MQKLVFKSLALRRGRQQAWPHDFVPGGLANWVAFSETPIKRWIEPEEVAELSFFG